MARRFPLQTLLDLARGHVDTAARNLHTLKVRWIEAQEKLEQLLNYIADYRNRLHQATRNGMPVSVMRDFQRFLGKLDVAVDQQQAEVARCKVRWEEGQQEWLRQKRKFNAYETLFKRHQKGELVLEARLEQREQDEHARKVFAAKKAHDEEE